MQRALPFRVRERHPLRASVTFHPCRTALLNVRFRRPPSRVHRPMDEFTVLIPTLTRRRSTAFLAATVAVMLAATTLLLGASAAHADDIDGFSGAPADEAAKDGRSRFSYQVAPGQQLEDRYLVRNTGTTAQTMTVFATDAFNTEAGDYALLSTDEVPSEAGAWITFAGGASKVELTLAPGTAEIVPFYLSVPADAGPGDHAGGLVISSVSSDGQVLVDRRVATRLYIRVPGDLQPGLTVSDFRTEYTTSLNPLQGETTVSFTVRNSGNVALSADMYTGVKTYLGIAASERLHDDIPELLPGSTREITTVIPGVAQLGYLDAYLQLMPKVDPGALNPGGLTAVERDGVMFAMPWWLLIALVIAGAVVLFLRLRARNDERRAAEWIEFMETEARRNAELEDKTPVPTSAPRADS